MSECLSVVMPAYNEEDTLLAISRRVLAVAGLSELVIVDDAPGIVPARLPTN